MYVHMNMCVKGLAATFASMSLCEVILVVPIHSDTGTQAWEPAPDSMGPSLRSSTLVFLLSLGHSKRVVVMDAFNPSTQAEEGGSLRIPGQPGLENSF